jgi:hypothetical protein
VAEVPAAIHFVSGVVIVFVIRQQDWQPFDWVQLQVLEEQD